MAEPSGTVRSGAEPRAAMPLAVSPVATRFEAVRRIAVLRGGGLGDLLFALPAISALRAAYPAARLTLLGSPAHAQLLAGRGVADAVEVLPIRHGVRDAAGAREDPAATESFLERMRQRSFDLAVQVHGGGRFSNPFLLELHAAHTVGTATADATRLERTLPYAYYQHEILRALEVAGLAGAAPVTLEPRLRVTERELEQSRGLPDDDARGLVVLHPGATDVRRRWPAERFAQLGARVARSGAQVIVVGDAGDRRLAGRIVQMIRASVPEAASRVTSLAGALSLPQLAGLLARSDVFVGNDSGPRHLAQAVGTRTVAVYWFGNLINAGPLGRGRHRVHLSWTTCCPVCGRDCTQVGWTAQRCEHEVSFVTDVPVEPVLADVLELLEEHEAPSTVGSQITGSAAPGSAAALASEPA